MSEAVELEPCPFCSGRARLMRKTGVHGTACMSRWLREWVVCQSKKCGASSAAFKRPGQAAKAWNRRAKPEGEPSLLGHLVETVAETVFVPAGQPIPLPPGRGSVQPVYSGPQSVTAKPEGEPVAWRFLFGGAPDGCWSYYDKSPEPEWADQCREVQPLYALPQADGRPSND